MPRLEADLYAPLGHICDKRKLVFCYVRKITREEKGKTIDAKKKPKTREGWLFGMDKSIREKWGFKGKRI